MIYYDFKRVLSSIALDYIQHIKQIHRQYKNLFNKKYNYIYMFINEYLRRSVSRLSSLSTI